MSSFFPEDEIPSRANIIRIVDTLADTSTNVRIKGKNATPKDIYEYTMAIRKCIEKEIDVRLYGFSDEIVRDIKKEKKSIKEDALRAGLHIYTNLIQSSLSETRVWDEIWDVVKSVIEESLPQASIVLQTRLSSEVLVDLARWAKKKEEENDAPNRSQKKDYGN